MTGILAVNRSGPEWQRGDPPIPIAILGSTGSIGTQTVDVVARMPERFRVVALSGGSNCDLLCQQAHLLGPDLVVSASGEVSSSDLPRGSRIAHGSDGLLEAATHPDVSIVVTATSGHAAIIPTARAIEAGKTIALANKETIVCGGALIMPLAEKHGVAIRPVDSEHSAIWQAIGSSFPDDIERLILTASGGPFRKTPWDEMTAVSAERALDHPTWVMGGKISIDSATLMNKGLEVIEAHWLFGVPFDRIDVVVHPESIIHSLVEFRDGSQIAQLGLPDMRLPIQYALTWPNHAPSPGKRLSLPEIGSLNFEAPDLDRFPALGICIEAGLAGGPYPAVLSSADEVAVAAFIDGRIRFTDIPAVVETALERYDGPTDLSFDSLPEIDATAHRIGGDAVVRLGR